MSVGLAIFDCENDVGVVLVDDYAVTVSAYWLTTRTLDLVIDYAGPGVSVIVDYADTRLRGHRRLILKSSH